MLPNVDVYNPDDPTVTISMRKTAKPWDVVATLSYIDNGAEHV